MKIIENVDLILGNRLENPDNIDCLRAIEDYVYFWLIAYTGLLSSQLFDKTLLWRDISFKNLLLKPHKRSKSNHHSSPLKPIPVSFRFNRVLLRLYFLRLGQERAIGQRLDTQNIFDSCRRSLENRLKATLSKVGYDKQVSDLKRLSVPYTTDPQTRQHDMRSVDTLSKKWPC